MSYGDTQYEGYNLVDLDKKKDAFLSGGQMVAKKGRYTYQVDKCESEALTAKALTITRGLNVVQPKPETRSGDDDNIIQRTVKPIAET